jgi:peptidoglycan hydrolase CwlO-like protein
LKVYKQKRANFEEDFSELDAERKRIMKKKKSKKEKAKQLKSNTKATFFLIVKSLNATVGHYKE